MRIKGRHVGRAREKETIEDGVPLRKKVYTIGLHFSSFCEKRPIWFTCTSFSLSVFSRLRKKDKGGKRKNSFGEAVICRLWFTLLVCKRMFGRVRNNPSEMWSWKGLKRPFWNLITEGSGEALLKCNEKSWLMSIHTCWSRLCQWNIKLLPLKSLSFFVISFFLSLSLLYCACSCWFRNLLVLFFAEKWLCMMNLLWKKEGYWVERISVRLLQKLS